MKCLILAAGYATRLYPLTKNFPKPLLKVLDKSIMDWMVDDLEETGKIDEIIVVSNHKFIHFFEEWKETKKAKITLIDDETTSNENRLGAMADIQLVIEKLKINEDLMVLAGDNVLDFSLKRFIDFFEEKKRTCVMSYYEEDFNKIKKSASIKIDNNNRVLEMIEKPENPTSHLCCPAFYIYAKEDVKMVKKAMEDGCNIDVPGSFINYLYTRSEIYDYQMPGRRYDIGNLESYEFVNQNYKGIIK